MKSLLIIGAGGHGKVVAEIATDCGYERIDFIDDNSEIAIGKISELNIFFDEYKTAFVGIGNNVLRGELIKKLEEIGYEIPVIVHPTAYISKTARIMKGTVIEPNAIVNANTVVNRGCIISVGSIIDHDVVLGECVHANAGSIVEAGAVVEAYYKLEAGEIVRGY